MDTVAVILAAVRHAKRVTLRHYAGALAEVQFDVDPKTFAECFARAGLRPGDNSGFMVVEAFTESCIISTVESRS